MLIYLVKKQWALAAMATKAHCILAQHYVLPEYLQKIMLYSVLPASAAKIHYRQPLTPQPVSFHSTTILPGRFRLHKGFFGRIG